MSASARDSSGRSLVDFTVERSGGMSRWKSGTEVRATMSSGGVAFNSRLRGSMPHFEMVASVREPVALFPSYPRKGYRGVFDNGQVRIERNGGQVVESRQDARAVVVSHRFRGDDLDLLYFKGYASWSYLNEPFYLLKLGFQLSEGEPWKEGGETWRRLGVVFPPDFPAHSQN